MIRQPPEDVDAFELFRILQSGCPLLDGQVVSISATATTATQSVRHGLGRPYRGAFVVSGPSSALVVRVLEPAAQAEPETYLYFSLSAATAVTAKLWVY